MPESDGFGRGGSALDRVTLGGQPLHDEGCDAVLVFNYQDSHVVPFVV